MKGCIHVARRIVLIELKALIFNASKHIHKFPNTCVSG
jgi:hypothetical protein